MVLDSDRPEFGGYGNIDDSVEHFTIPDPLYDSAGVAWLKLYLPPRTATVLRRSKK